MASRRAPWALVALLMVPAAGCGDDGGTPAPTDGGVDAGPTPDPVVTFPRNGIQPEELAVLVAEGDATSEALGAYYVAARGLPAENLVRVPVATDANVLSQADFEAIQEDLEARLPAGTQALLLAWTTPYRVDCMSITAAFALGFDTRFCNRTGGACGTTAPSGYFFSDSTRPFDDHGLRPTMMLGVATEEDGRALIDRGVAADDTFPTGDGYFLRTTDAARSVRWPVFERMPGLWDHEGGLRLFYRDAVDGDDDAVLRDTDDVLVYQTGFANVADIDTNTYLPGAVADHLTSFGGRVPDAGGQMSVTRWLEAGATGSYGTALEPCNFTDKFPDPRALLATYFRGASLIEAYWKSVNWPGEGVFVGEPLARPWGAQVARVEGDTLVLETNVLAPRDPYVVEAADDPAGPWRVVLDGIGVERARRVTVRIDLDGSRYYRLRPG